VSALRAFSTAAPGPAVVMIGKWLKLFSDTIIAYPEWQIDATNLALAVGVVAAIVLPFTMEKMDKRILKGFGICLLSLTFILIVICVAIWFHLGPPESDQARVNVASWHDIWELCYVLAMICLIVSVTFLTMSIDEKHNILFWIVTVIAIIILVVGIVFSIVHFVPGRMV
jgi:hypothetical protein